MDLGISTWFGYKYPFVELIKLIKKSGFHSVMTWWGDEFIQLNGPKENHPDIIRNNGLKIENIHLTFNGVNAIWVDSQSGQDILDLYLSYIDDCKIYEIPTAVMHVLEGENPPPFGQLGLDRFKRIIDRAEKNNINVAVENLNKPEYLDYVLNGINSNRLRFCYDSGHEHCFTPDMEYLKKYSSKLIALHLHDNNGMRDQHLLPFCGTINWKHIMNSLREINYTGSLAFEIEAQSNTIEGYTADDYLSEAMARAKKIMEL